MGGVVHPILLKSQVSLHKFENCTNKTPWYQITTNDVKEVVTWRVQNFIYVSQGFLDLSTNIPTPSPETKESFVKSWNVYFNFIILLLITSKSYTLISLLKPIFHSLKSGYYFLLCTRDSFSNFHWLILFQGFLPIRTCTYALFRF